MLKGFAIPSVSLLYQLSGIHLWFFFNYDTHKKKLFFSASGNKSKEVKRQLCNVFLKIFATPFTEINSYQLLSYYLVHILYNTTEPKHITNCKNLGIPKDFKIWYVKYNLIVELYHFLKIICCDFQIMTRNFQLQAWIMMYFVNNSQNGDLESWGNLFIFQNTKPNLGSNLAMTVPSLKNFFYIYNTLFPPSPPLSCQGSRGPKKSYI